MLWRARICSAQLGGSPAIVGWKGADGVTRMLRKRFGLTGVKATERAAPMVSVGAAPEEGLVKRNRVPQGDPSPDTPPAELMHGASTSPSVFSLVGEAEEPTGSAGPGSVPWVVSTYSWTAAKAVANAAASELPDPTAEYEVMYGARLNTDAIVVSSLTKIKLDVLRVLHRPRAAIMARFGLLVPAAMPGLPPVAVR